MMQNNSDEEDENIKFTSKNINDGGKESIHTNTFIEKGEP
jgi:hypothetical protein